MLLRCASTLILVLCLFGCSHTLDQGVPPARDAVWRAETVRVIALDLQDGVVDYVWPDDISQTTRDVIVQDARKLNQNSTGER
jgi:hypothetical protein